MKVCGNRLLILSLILSWLAVPGAVPAADDGSRVFQELKCGLCHKPDQKGAGPNLQSIAQAYDQQREGLIAYLTGTNEARMGIAKPDLMKGSLGKIQQRSAEDIAALAAHLLSFKPR